MTDWNLLPEDIETRSFAIIDEESQSHDWPPDAWTVVRRMIHTSGDFDYVTTTRMHPRAVEAGVEAIRQGRPIMTDTRMAQSGMSKRRLDPFGVTVDCLIDHPETAQKAKEDGTTRAVAAMDLGWEAAVGGIIAVGNAPTALFRLLEHVQAGRPGPALIVGVPVGFVNAAESKDALLESTIPYITALGRKGGSNVAAAVINALAVLALKA